MSRRTERVAELLRAELAATLRAHVSDPRVALVTVTRVEVSPDLRNATVFWSRMDTRNSPPVQETAAGLARAAAYLRRRLAKELPLKRVPALEFRHDPSLVLGDQTLAALRELNGSS